MGAIQYDGTKEFLRNQDLKSIHYILGLIQLPKCHLYQRTVFELR